MADFSPPLLQTELPSNQNKFPFPSTALPPNYVTLQQLQEKRVKQQQEREAKEKEEERQRQREEAEEERKRQREAKEEKEERKKQLDLEKSLKSLETKPSDRSSRCNWGNRLKIAADKRGEIPTVEREIDGHGKSIERSNKKNIGIWREKTSPGERKTLTDGDPAHLLPENGKSAVDRKIGGGFLAVKMNRTAKVARETEDLETKGRKEEEERSTAVEKKGRAQSPPVESLPEKIGSNVVDDRMVEIDRQKISNNEIEGSTGGGKEADGTANKKLYSTPKREKYVKKKIGNVGVVNCDQTVEGEKKVGEGSNECGLGRRGEKKPATREENVEKEDKAVESAHKIEELEIIDCDEANGENAGSFGQRSRRSFGYRKKKGGNVEAYQTVERGKEVEEGLNEHGLGRPGEAFSPDLKLFVGNLPFNVDSSELAGLFVQAGNVQMVEVIYDKTTGRSRGFGFVTMSSPEEVKAAEQQFNGYELDGRPLRVNSGPPPPKDDLSPRGFRVGGGAEAANRVYVGNLSWGVDDVALESLFSEQGKVMDAKVVYDRDSGRSRGFGFVTYSSAEEVDNAISSLNGVDLKGRQIRVTVAEARPRRVF